MDLGRLPELMDRLAGFGSGITIAPVMEEVLAFGGPDTPGTGVFVAGWEITYETTQGRFTVSGQSIPEAVEAAFANRASW